MSFQTLKHKRVLSSDIVIFFHFQSWIQVQKKEKNLIILITKVISNMQYISITDKGQHAVLYKLNKM